MADHPRPPVVVGVKNAASAYVVWHAAHWAQRLATRLTLVRAYELPEDEPLKGNPGLRAKTDMADLVTSLEPAVRSLVTSVEIIRGPVGPVLVGQAERAVLLAVGHTGLLGLRAGSLGEFCAMNARSPVIVVHLSPFGETRVQLMPLPGPGVTASTGG